MVEITEPNRSYLTVKKTGKFKQKDTGKEISNDFTYKIYAETPLGQDAANELQEIQKTFDENNHRRTPSDEEDHEPKDLSTIKLV